MQRDQDTGCQPNNATVYWDNEYTEHKKSGTNQKSFFQIQFIEGE